MKAPEQKQGPDESLDGGAAGAPGDTADQPQGIARLLAEIAGEPVPERLLELARELQKALRERRDDGG